MNYPKHLAKITAGWMTLVLCLLFAGRAAAQNYYAYVACESSDQVYKVKFNGQKAEVLKKIDVGIYPAEMEGPHGLTVSPDGKYWFVSIAHGLPFGHIWKFDTATDQFIGKVEVGMFPASMEISPATGLLYVVNFNLHGDMKPSTVSVVDPESMSVIDDIPTGIMPHGSRITSDGLREYHVSMMTDELMEINTLSQKISRRLNIADNKQLVQEASVSHPKPVAKPTWADPHPNKPLVYVAENGADEVAEVDTKKWTVTRRFKTGKAPYNLEVSPDGEKLVVSYKGEGATGIWDLKSGKELAKIQNSKMVTHGVAVTPDSRYAFITAEGKGGEPGAVDIIDLNSLKRVASINVGKQAGGVYFWKQD